MWLGVHHTIAHRTIVKHAPYTIDQNIIVQCALCTVAHRTIVQCAPYIHHCSLYHYTVLKVQSFTFDHYSVCTPHLCSMHHCAVCSVQYAQFLAGPFGSLYQCEVFTMHCCMLDYCTVCNTHHFTADHCAECTIQHCTLLPVKQGTVLAINCPPQNNSLCCTMCIIHQYCTLHHWSRMDLIAALSKHIRMEEMYYKPAMLLRLLVWLI